jgi:Domain of unknown function (DUF3883)
MTLTSYLPTSLSMPESTAWAGAAGLPTRHIAQAAMHVAALIDRSGSREADARESYWHRATGGRFPPAELARGQTLLLDVGLLVRDGEVLRPTDQLADLLNGSVDDAFATLAACVLARATSVPSTGLDPALVDLVPDAVRREELLLHLARRFDARARTEVGDAGERLVLAAARAELASLGRHDLAQEVCRVSLISDQLGYDIRAPRVDGSFRRLEVKATTKLDSSDVVRVFISRNESETGRRITDWALVGCLVEDAVAASGSLLGWWSYDVLATRLPSDTTEGRWEQAQLTLPLGEAHPGIPGAVL